MSDLRETLVAIARAGARGVSAAPAALPGQREREMRAALEEIRALLESPSWYDGEEAVDRLLDRMGFLVERVLP
jgi:hypothetical protein